MKLNKYLGSFLLLVCIITVGTRAHQSAAPTPAPGVAEGQKIGTIIKSAITTAAPGISSILDLVWSHLSKPTADKATKTELQTAAKATPDSVEEKTQAAIQTKIQPVGQVADELAVIAKFLGPTSKATQYLIVMRTKAADQSTDWKVIGNAWEVSKAQIASLKSVSDSDLGKVRDPYLRAKLAEMRDANDTSVILISQEVSQKNLPDLKSDLPALLSILANMTGMAGYEIAELQAEITDLSKWAHGAMDSSDTLPKQQLYIDFLEENLRSTTH
jgi:hypothetical protein